MSMLLRSLITVLLLITAFVSWSCSCNPDTDTPPPTPVDLNGKIKPEFTDLSVGILITNAGSTLSATDFSTKVMGRMRNFLLNSNSAIFLNPDPQLAYADAAHASDVPWLCSPVIKQAWANTVTTSSNTVVDAFVSMLNDYAILARANPTLPIDCHIINMELPMGTTPGVFTGATYTILNNPAGQPRVVRIVLQYTPGS